jgi:Protein of unknown function (DUF4244)
MIAALLRLFHLLDRWRSDCRRDPWTEPSSHRTSSPGRRRPIRSGPVPYLRPLRSDIGMTTAEYAVGTVAAVAFAVVLFKVVQSPAVHSALSAVVTGALNVHL